MNARDELADVFTGHPVAFGAYPKRLMRGHAQEIAEKVLAAGYHRPRVVTTVAELDALPEGTTIVDQAERLTLEETSIQYLEWVDRHGNACHVELPATVLHEPEADQ